MCIHIYVYMSVAGHVELDDDAHPPQTRVLHDRGDVGLRDDYYLMY